MTTQPRPQRPLIDLPLAELRRALRATEEAIGADSYSANTLRKAISEKQRGATTEGRRDE